MALNPYENDFNLLLDGLLNDDEERALRRSLIANPQHEAELDRMLMVDAILRGAEEPRLPANFSANVMVHVDRYEQRVQWTPWVIALVTTVTVSLALFIAAPLVIFNLGLAEPLLSLPRVSSLVLLLAQSLEWMRLATVWGAEAIVGWLTFITTEPATLAVIISALALVSIWVGFRESQRAGAFSAA